MIPFILAAVGGYLIGDSEKQSEKFAGGGNVLDLDDFKWNIKDVSVTGFKGDLLGVVDIDLDTTIENADVSFDMEAEVKRWGIKYITINVKSVTAILIWSVDTDGLSEDDEKKLMAAGGYSNKYHNYIQGEYEIESKDWDIVNEAEFSSSGGFCFTSCEFDFTNKKIILS